MTVKLLTEQHLKLLSLKRGNIGSSESTLVKCHIVGNHMSRLKYTLTLAMLNPNILVCENNVNPDHLAFTKPPDQDQHWLSLLLKMQE